MSTAGLLNRLEKAYYPFKSYPRRRCATLLFAGCAFPSQFPRTMDALAQACRRAGFGVAYDCCGQPLAGYGAKRAGERVSERLRARLARLGCERLVCVCPNCLSHLDGRLDCKVVSIFDVLDEIGIGGTDAFEEGSLFIPCPDKRFRAIESTIRGRFDLTGVRTLEKVGCCGLRADIAARGSTASCEAGMKVVEAAQGGALYSYCASCLGQFARLGHENCIHVLSVLMGMREEPDTHHALANRARRKFDRNVEPFRIE